MIDPGFTFGYNILAFLLSIFNYLKLHFAILPPKIIF